MTIFLEGKFHPTIPRVLRSDHDKKKKTKKKKKREKKTFGI